MPQGPLKNLADRIPAPTEPLELDATDLKLLTELSRDGRAPLSKLAETLGMSSPGVADRIARLKARGAIRGFRADIDWDVLGASTVAYLSIVASVGQDQNAVIEKLLQVRGVEEITVVTGSRDMLVKLRARGFDALRTVLATEVWSIEGIQQTETSIALIRAAPEEFDVGMIELLPHSG